MLSQVRSRFVKSAAVAVLALSPLFAFAGDRREPVGRMAAGAGTVSWPVNGDAEKVVLVVSGPNGYSMTKEFAAGTTPTFRLQDINSKTPDGTYTYELRVVPHVSDRVREALAAARLVDDDAAVERIQREAGLANAVVQSGAVTVLHGSFVSADTPEPAYERPTVSENATTGSNVSANASAPGHGAIGTNDTVVVGNESIQGSLCVGIDCATTESYGFDTQKLKENNTRLLFDDTSSSAGFPAEDWRLEANDSASGGVNRFSVVDVTATTTPFTIRGSAPTNSFYMAADGKIGLHTSSPLLDVHIQTGNTPAIRMEQTNSGGFTAQTWDIGSNEANFFVRDLTGGSKLPFRIRPGAPTSSVDIAASGNVGIGTASPTQRTHIYQNADVNSIALNEDPYTGTSAAAVYQTKSDTAILSVISHSSARTISRFGQTLGGWNEILAASGNGVILGTAGATPLILGTNSLARLTIDSSGNVTIPGNLSVTGVKNFAVPDPTDANKALYYTALEGPEAGTYFRGSAKTVDGEVTIELPSYFAHLTEAERMTVQLTPVGEYGQLFVQSKSPEKIVIKVASGSKDLQFDYLVQGVRKGYLDYSVERTGVFPVKN